MDCEPQEVEKRNRQLHSGQWGALATPYFCAYFTLCEDALPNTFRGELLRLGIEDTPIIRALPVHGGVTFSDTRLTSDKTYFFKIGWDYHHYGDEKVHRTKEDVQCDIITAINFLFRAMPAMKTRCFYNGAYYAETNGIYDPTRSNFQSFVAIEKQKADALERLKKKAEKSALERLLTDPYPMQDNPKVEVKVAADPVVPDRVNIEATIPPINTANLVDKLKQLLTKYNN